jgi:hypothetical protein
MDIPEILAAHPEPDDLTGPLPYLYPPSKLSSTARWIAFRDKTLLPMMRMYPDDENLPKFLRQVQAVLAWRAADVVRNRRRAIGRGAPHEGDLA